MPEALYAPLLPCPFCGHEEPTFERVGTPRQSCIVFCGNCGCRHESSDEGAGSGTQWNTRADATSSLRGSTTPSATCENCGGTGEYFTHADDCKDNLCALNGDMHSCVGQVVPCDCSLRGGQQGWRLVPIQPTPEMVARAMKECAGIGAGSCGEHAGVDGDDMRSVWEAMLDAAPSPPPSTHPQETKP